MHGTQQAVWRRSLLVMALFSVAWTLGCPAPNDGNLTPCEQPGDVCPSRNGQAYECVEKLCRPRDGGTSPQDGGGGGLDAGTQDDGGTQDAGPQQDGGASAAGTQDAGIVVPEAKPSCSDAGWCWENPASLGASLQAVRGAPGDGVWAVGERGVALFWNGARWTRVEPATGSTLLGVDRVQGAWWAVGDNGALLRWDGARWVAQPAPAVRLNQLSVAPSGNQALIVGNAGTVLAYNNGGWSLQTPPDTLDLTSVWLASDEELWAADKSGLLLHRLNGVWTSIPPVVAAGLSSLHGSSPDAGLAVGSAGTVLRLDNGVWTSAGPVGAADLAQVWMTGPQEGWMVGPQDTAYRVDGGGFEAVPSGAHQPQRAVFGSSASDFWAVGDRGSITHWDGNAWTESAGGWTGAVHALWSGGGDDVWAVGDGFHALRQPDTGQWTLNPDAGFGAVSGLSGSSGYVWAVGGQNQIYRFRDGGWTPDPTPAQTSGSTLTAVYSTVNNGTWAVGSGGAVLNEQGLRNPWSSLGDATTATSDLHGVWSEDIGDGDVWAVGTNGGLFRLTSATGWVAHDAGVGSATFNAVWGATAKDLWVVGENGLIVHGDGATWSPVPSGVTASLYGVTGTSSTSVWAVGASGTLLFWNGSTWTPQNSGTNVDLLSVWVASGGVWAAGKQGVVIHLAR